MKIKIFISVCAAVVLFSYCNQKKGLQSILSVNCYWDIWDIGSPHPINSCYKFSEGGDCGFYYYHFLDKKKTDSVFLFNDDDVVIPNKWKVSKDSIQIRANKYYVIRYNPDSVFLTATGRDTMILIKNCATYNPKKK